MLRPTQLLFLGSFLCVGCVADVDPSPGAPAIDAYIRSLPRLPSEPPKVVEGQRSAATTEGDYSCSSTTYSETRQHDEVVAYAANSDSLWPGALVGGDSIYSGLFTQLVLPRRPMTVSVSLENLAGAKSARLQQPSLSSFREAISTILAANVTGATPARISSDIDQVHSEKQLALALGASVEWLGSAAAIRASFDFSSQNTRSRYVVKYTQAYYTVDIDPPAHPSDFFDPAITLPEVQRMMGPQNPPLYVSSITYGRMVVFTFESQYSGDELNTALEIGFHGGVDANVNVAASYKDIISSSKITAFILGGSGGEAARTIDSYDALIDFIKSGGNYSNQSPGAPIAYKLAYLADKQPARLSFTTDYEVKECARVSQKVKVILKSIRVDSAGGDQNGGEDLEVFGHIRVVGETTASLLELDGGHAVTIRQGQTWSEGDGLAEAIVQVKPAAGNSITLDTDIWDRDDIGGDDNLVRVDLGAPFESGWRREVTVQLTGSETRGAITLALQPI